MRRCQLLFVKMERTARRNGIVKIFADQRIPDSKILPPVLEIEIFYLQFWAIFDQIFDKSSEPIELNGRREACNSAK